MGLPAVITGKCCSKCSVWKPFECFHKQQQGRFGRASICAACKSIYFTGYRKHNATRLSTYKRFKYYEDPTRNRIRHLYNKYGITVQDFDQMILDQGGRCRLCLVVFDEESPCVDHCHGTGRVRGLLCRKCNLDLSSAESDPAWLDRAKEYLGAA